MKYTKLLISFVLTMLALPVMAITIEGATEGYNRLVFPMPYTKIVITPESPLMGEPLPMAEKRSVLLRLKKGSKAPAQLFIQLVNGEAFPLTIIPNDRLKPQTWRYKGAADSRPGDVVSLGRANDKWVVDTLFSALDGNVPDGFDVVQTGPIAELGPIRATPISSFRTAGYALNLYRLESNTLVSLRERDFYRQGVVAVLLESDVVSPQHEPNLVVLESVDE